MSRFNVGDTVLRSGCVARLKFKWKIMSKKGWWIFSTYLLEGDKKDGYYIEENYFDLYKAPKLTTIINQKENK